LNDKYSIKKISVILPTYNEKENIIPLIENIINDLKNYEFEIIVIDDNSPDLTWKCVEEKSKIEKRVRIKRRIDKRGLCSALNDGIEISNGCTIVWMDSDLQMPSSKVPELIKQIENGYDIAVGSRFEKGGADLRYNENLNQKIIIKIHRYLSLFLNQLISKLYKIDFKDWTSGFIAIKKYILEQRKLRGDYGEYFINLMHYAIKSGYKYIEIPFEFKPRFKGTSKTFSTMTGIIKKSIKYIYTIIKLKFIKYK